MGDLPSLEGLETPLVPTLDSDTLQVSIDAPRLLITIQSPRPTQMAQYSSVTLAKIAFMTLANNGTFTRLVVDIPQYT